MLLVATVQETKQKGNTLQNAIVFFFINIFSVSFSPITPQWIWAEWSVFPFYVVYQKF